MSSTRACSEGNSDFPGSNLCWLAVKNSFSWYITFLTTIFLCAVVATCSSQKGNISYKNDTNELGPVKLYKPFCEKYPKTYDSIRFSKSRGSNIDL